MKGFINICKPLYMTSSDVVVKVRGILRRVTGEKQKVGHFGTLDPLATGVLPIAVGNATRLFDYAQAKTKVYQTTFVFGKTTDTLDRAGNILEENAIVPTTKDVENVLQRFVGIFEQIPPQYSAKSVNGRRAYDLAREGIFVQLAPKKIQIYNIKLLEDFSGTVHLQNGDISLANGEFAFEIECSGGTYIRSIVRDMATMLNTIGYMSSIHRIKSGNFNINDSVSLEEFEKNPIRYIESMNVVLNSFPKYTLSDSIAHRALNGIKLQLDDLPKKEVFAVIYKGDIIGMATNDNGVLNIRTRL